jgi:hypothetical protein
MALTNPLVKMDIQAALGLTLIAQAHTQRVALVPVNTTHLAQAITALVLTS